jgi:hypothetical protein
LPRLWLALVVVLYALLGIAYAVFTPKWQAPDEPAHFNYIRTIAETGTLPVLQAGDYDQDYLEEIKAAKFPASMPVDSIRYESYQPPLYYLAAAPVYLAARAGGIDPVIPLRLFSVSLGALGLVVAFVVVNETLDSPWIALGAAGLMATVPMYLAITASISNDAAANLLLALILLLSLRRAKGRVSDRRFVFLGGLLFGAALLTKQTAYVTGAALLVGAEVIGNSKLEIRNPNGEGEGTGGNLERATARNSQPDLRIANFQFPISNFQFPISNLLLLFLLAGALAAPMFVRNILVYGVSDPLGIGRHDAIVAGQPTTAEMIAQKGPRPVLTDFVTTSFRSFWAQFGWMGVPVDDRIYLALALLTLVALLGLALCVIRVVRQREQLNAAQRTGLILLALLLAVAVVDYVGYNSKFYQPQGRYLFPALVPIALCFVLGLREAASREHARVLAALLYLALLGLDVVSLVWYIVPQL